MKRAVFCVPDWDRFSSGANVYNRRVWNVLKEQYPDRYRLSHHPGFIEPDCGLLILDSLFVDAFTTSSQKGNSVFLLAHFLKHLRPRDYSEVSLEAEARILEQSTVVICTGYRSRDILKESFPSANIIVFEPGLDDLPRAEFNQPVQDDFLKVVIASNPVPEKDVLSFLNHLMEFVGAAGATRIRIDWFGDESIQIDYAELCLEMIRRLRQKGLAVQFRSVLPREQYLEVLRSSDLFIHPARSESYGLAIVEAARMGIPVLCLESANAAEAVRDGVNGFLKSDQPALISSLFSLAESHRSGNPLPFSDVPVKTTPSWKQQAVAMHRLVMNYSE